MQYVSRLGLVGAVVGVCLSIGSDPALGDSARPQAVSPGSPAVATELADSCPTFSWSGVPGATGYELVVYRVADEGELESVLQVEVSGDARGWTPSASQCPRSGSSYAWAVRARYEEGLGVWSEALLFETARKPTEDEVRRALRVLRRYTEMVRNDHRDGELEAATSRHDQKGVVEEFEEGKLRPSLQTIREDLHRDARRAETRIGRLSPADVQSAAAPALGDASITIAEQFHMADGSALFKDDQLFLWDDTLNNLALGRGALASASGTATGNTAVGRGALQNTTYGSSSPEGSTNTALGASALASNTTGSRNTASGFYTLFSNSTGYMNTASGGLALFFNDSGYQNTADGYLALFSNTAGAANAALGYGALFSNTTGSFNTAVGIFALVDNDTGVGNIALGAGAGQNITGSYNIMIGNYGNSGDNGTIRIGSGQNRTFIDGIRGATTDNANAVTVVIDSAGQLGTISSSEAIKRDIRDLGVLSNRLMALRPVAFRFEDQVATHPEAALEFGLIAEEVAKVFPELVVRDEDGRPQAVKYRLLSTLLLNELQRHQAELERQRALLREHEKEVMRLSGIEAEVTDLRRRVEALTEKRRLGPR